MRRITAVTLKNLFFAFHGKLAIIFLLFLLAGSVSAQTSSTDISTPTGLSRGAPSGSYSLTGFDDINLFNGNLNFHLPLLHVGGRGAAQTTMTLALNTKSWHVLDYSTEFYSSYALSQGGWYGMGPGYGPGVLKGRQSGIQTQVCQQSWPHQNEDYTIYQYTTTVLTFVAPDGTEYELRDPLPGGGPLLDACNVDYTGPSRGKVFTTADGSAMTFISDDTIYDRTEVTNSLLDPSGYLLMRDGTRYRVDAGLVSWIRDRNGNRIRFTYDASSRVSTITDSLNRQVTVQYDYSDESPYGTCDRIHFKGFGGADRIIRISKNSLSNAFRTTQTSDVTTPQTLNQLFPGLGLSNNNPFNPTVVSAVYLPDNETGTKSYLHYQFYYNPYNELTRVELPTGGAVEYDMTTGSGITGSDPGDIYRRVTKKRIYSGSSMSTLQNTEVYVATYANSGDAHPWYTTVTVDHLNSAGTRLACEKHYFNGSAAASLVEPSGTHTYVFPAWDEGRETKTEALDIDGVTVLHKIENTWRQRASVSWWGSWGTTWQGFNQTREPANDVRLVESVTTLVDANLVAKKTSISPVNGAVGFDQYNNPTDVWETGFGSGAPGSWVRHSHTDYVTSNTVGGTTYNYDTVNPSNTSPDINSTYHIRSLVKRQQVYAVNASTGADSSTASADAQFYYDQSSLTTHASISGLCTVITSPTQCDNTSPASLVARGNMTRTSHWRNTDGAWLNTDAAFDIVGNVVTVTDPLNHQTSLYYDDNFGAPNGEARMNTAPTELSSLSSYAFLTKATNVLGHTAYAQFDYYTCGAVDGEDINGVISSAYYNDPMDRPTQVIRSVNVAATKSQTTFNYDDTGRAITTTSDQASYGDNLLKSELSYDGLGRTAEIHSFESSTAYIISKQIYDALGRAWKSYNPYRTTSDATYGWTETTYDALSRAKRVETFDAGSVSTGAVLTSYSGNTVTVTDQTGKARKSVADAQGRMTSVYEDPSGLNYQTSYSYDVLDDLTGVTQGSQSRSFSYNSLKQLTSATNPEICNQQGSQCTPVPTTYQYDNAGNLILKIDPRGGGTSLPNCSIPYTGSNVATCYAYDSLNRISSRTYNDSTPNVTYSYDMAGINYSKGRLTSVSSSASTTSYNGFDALGGVTQSSQTTNNQTYSFGYSYDLAGEMKTETYPSGRVVQTSYDQAGRISKVEVPNVKVYMDSFSYTAQGAVSSVRLGNNLWEHESFNSRLQTTEIGVGTSSTDSSTLKLNYGYGTTSNNGNVQSQTITLLNLTLTQSYIYDSLNRLQSAQEMNGSTQTWKQTYVYDRYGNRNFDSTNTTVPSQLSASNNPTINTSNNRIDSSITGQSNVLYDSAGNLTRDVSGNTYSYDAENHQTLLNNGDVQVGASYFYDGDGKRVKKAVGTSATIFVYDAGDRLIAEYSGSSSTGGTSYLTQDGLGSPRVITDSNGAVRSRHDYLPFGEEIASSIGSRSSITGYNSTDNTRQHFTGQIRDVESGLDYFNARYYSSIQGRFTGSDPLDGTLINPQSLNKYSYCLNNPLALTDPTGMMASSKSDPVNYSFGLRQGGVYGNLEFGSWSIGTKDSSWSVPNAENNSSAGTFIPLKEMAADPDPQDTPEQYSSNSTVVIVWDKVKGLNPSSMLGHVSYITQQDDISYSWPRGILHPSEWDIRPLSSDYTNERSHDSTGRGYILDFGPELNAKFQNALIHAYDLPFVEVKHPYGLLNYNCGRAFNVAINAIRGDLNNQFHLNLPKSNSILPSRIEAYIRNNLLQFTRGMYLYPKH